LTSAARGFYSYDKVTKGLAEPHGQSSKNPAKKTKIIINLVDMAADLNVYSRLHKSIVLLTATNVLKIALNRKESDNRKVFL
jgi:hypothetical protein